MALVETPFGLRISSSIDNMNNGFVIIETFDDRKSIKINYDQWKELQTFVPLLHSGWSE